MVVLETEINKSSKCLQNAYTAFLEGNPEHAIRSLNIAFNHVTNTDWSAVDVQRILRTLSWLYFYTGRYDKVEEQLEEAIFHFKKTFQTNKVALAYLYYNLAESHRRQDRLEQCKVSFLTSLDLLESSVGVEHRSFAMIYERYLEVCVNESVEIDFSDDFFELEDDGSPSSSIVCGSRDVIMEINTDHQEAAEFKSVVAL
ncbi:MAG TPA: tetratricopeptide repeat protein [Oculatellaceae cyanobacterium]